MPLAARAQVACEFAEQTRLCHICAVLRVCRMVDTVTVRVAGYVRATPVEQARGELTPPSQRRRLEEHSTSQGWDLARIAEDIGFDGEIGRTPALRDLVRAPGDIQKLMIVRLDRLGRSTRLLNRVLRPVQEAGVDLVAIEEAIDTGAESGRVVAGLLSKLETWEPRAVPANSAWHPDRLRSNGFEPATVIDVGAASGTRPLLEAFPDAHHVLIEPLAEFAEPLRTIVSQFDAEWLQTAVGAQSGTITIGFDPAHPLMSSALPALTATRATDSRPVPLTTLDDLLELHRWKPPFLLKLDTEGFEHDVVAGARHLLGCTDRVIAEVSVSPRFAGSLLCGDFFTLMRSHEFEVRDLVDAARSPLGAHADVLFTKSSP